MSKRSYPYMTKLFIVLNEDYFLLTHRKELAVRAQESGYDVTIVAKNTGRRKQVEALGLKMVELPVNPTGKNPIEELKAFWFLYRLYKREKPDIVHHVGLKVILWGGLAAKLTDVKGVVNAVSGLGVMFSLEKESRLTSLILSVLRFSNHRKNLINIFQNHEDERLFIEKGVVTHDQIRFIKGSGVDLKRYAYTLEPVSDKIRILFTARMVEEKGVWVLVNAAESLRKEYEGRVCFLLCGGLSSNPKAIKEEELNDRCDGNYIQWLGYRSDVPDLLRSSHIVAFPSYYREGVPKSLIEATAIGRPIVTTDSIGCKDTVEDGTNGFLVPIKDNEALAEKLRILIDDTDLRKRMGLHSRQIAERDFSLDDVIAKHLLIYRELLHCQ
ncbi:glycosyltransferase family 4 protein [Parabacteroides distasonis]|nr:glycosyltransferase family 4 protein [Parabacteroides distasonis]